MPFLSNALQVSGSLEIHRTYLFAQLGVFLLGFVASLFLMVEIVVCFLSLVTLYWSISFTVTCPNAERKQDVHACFEGRLI